MSRETFFEHQISQWQRYYDSATKRLILAPMIRRNLAQETDISAVHHASGSTNADGVRIGAVERDISHDRVSQRYSNISNIRKLTILVLNFLRHPDRKPRIPAVYAFTFLLERRIDAQMFSESLRMTGFCLGGRESRRYVLPHTTLERVIDAQTLAEILQKTRHYLGGRVALLIA